MQLGTQTGARPRKPKLYYGWIIVIVLAVAQFTEAAEIYPVLGVLIKPMTAEFGWSRSTWTLATSIGTFLGGFAGPLIGPAIDRWGAKWILLISFTVLGIMMIAMAFVQELWQFYVVQIISRFIAQGVINLALVIIIPNWFIKKRARATALSGMGGRFGNAITPIYVQALVSGYSWRVASVTTGMVILAFSLLPVALWIKRKPEDIGLLPDGETPEEHANAAEAAAKTGKPVSKTGDLSFTLKQVIRMPAFYLLAAGNVFNILVGPALNLHMVPYFTDKGIDAGVAVLVTTTLFVSSAGGSLVFGFLSEKFGIRRVITIDYVFMGLGFIFLLMVTNVAGAFAWAVYMGIVQGGGQTLNQVIFADYFGRGSLGAIRGAMTPVQLGAQALGPLLAAMAFDRTGTYFAIFLVFGVARLVSGLAVLLAKPPPGSAAAQQDTKKEVASAAR